MCDRTQTVAGSPGTVKAKAMKTMVKMRESRPVRLWQVAAVGHPHRGDGGDHRWDVGSGTAPTRTTTAPKLRANAAQLAVTTKKTLDGYVGSDRQRRGVVHAARSHRSGRVPRLREVPGPLPPVQGDLRARLHLLGSRRPPLPAFVAGWRADGDPDFSVAPAGDVGPPYCLASQFDEQNLKTTISIVGYDVCTVPQLASVLDLATDQRAGPSGVGVRTRGLGRVPGELPPGGPRLQRRPDDRRRSDVHSASGWVAALVDGRQMLTAALGPTRAHLGVEPLLRIGVVVQGSWWSRLRAVLGADGTGSVTEHFTAAGTWTMRVHPLSGAPGPANPLAGPLAGVRAWHCCSTSHWPASCGTWGGAGCEPRGRTWTASDGSSRSPRPHRSASSRWPTTGRCSTSTPA